MGLEGYVRAAVVAACLAASVRGAAPGGAAPEPSASVDLAQPGRAPGSVMTGTAAERKAAIEKVLAGDGGKVAQMTLNEIDMATAARFLTQQWKIDIAISFEALAKAGVEQGPVTLNLYDATPKMVLEAMRWQVGPKEGGVAWKVEEGVLRLVPVEKAERAVETEGEKKGDAAAKAALKTPIVEIVMEHGLPTNILRFLGQQTKTNIVVDWQGLARAGMDKDTGVTMHLKGVPAEEVLRTMLGGIKLKEGEAGYEVWGGLVRVGTRARLEREKPVEVRVGVEGGMP